ncbi:TIGR00180 family glycosyltransferase [Pseudomonas sp. NPDC090202]|uniref:TIGR00180 family glycosyltransferase n=1 Tax=unclassified Pseudomonas TaxID=196821 RepID=UPI003817D0D1
MKVRNSLDGAAPLNELLTVVVLSHNRPAFLRRALAYYSAFSCKVLVLDSSAQALDSVETRLPSVDYRHLPQYAYWGFQAKVGYGVGLVETPYMVLAADDDFIVQKSLGQAVAFLEEQPDYSMCHGYCMMYASQANSVGYLRRDKKVREDYDDERAEDRIVSYMGQYLPPFYAVTRSQVLKDFFNAMPDNGFEWMEIGHVFYLLARGKARVLPIPYVVREVNIGNSEHNTEVYHKLSYLDPKTVAEREAFAEFLAAQPTQLAEGAEQRKQFALVAFEAMAQGLRDRASLTIEPIFRSIWTDPLSNPERIFGPRQYVEMPFYNQTFFDTLTEIEYLLHAMPAGYLQLSELEGVWVRQQALLQIHDNDVPETILNRLWQAAELSPFNREVVNALALRLSQQVEAGLEEFADDAQRMADWAARLAAAPAYDYRKTFEGMGSGRVLKWLESRSPDAAQGVALSQRLAEVGGGPQFGLFLLNMDDDMERLQVTLDSLVEGYCKRFKIVVLTTGEPPAATTVNNTLHFVKVTRSNHVDKLNQLIRQTECDWVMLAEVGDVFTSGGLIRASLELQGAPDCRAVSVDEIQRLDTHAVADVFRPGFNLDLLQSVPSLMSRHWLVRRDVLLDVGGYSADFADAMELDLLLRIIEDGGMNGLAHLDEPLLVCRAQPPQDNEHERLALSRHLAARGYKALISSSQPGVYQIDYRHSARPLVSIIVNGSDDLVALQACLTSVLQRTRYSLYEVLVAVSPALEAPLNAWLAEQGKDAAQVQVVANRDGLSHGALINDVAAHTNGDYLVLLAGDSQVVSPNWVGSLLNQALRPEVGAVGAKLIDEHGKVTQGGLLLGFEGAVGSPFVGLKKEDDGYLFRAVVEQNHSALSGTCVMVRKEVFDALGGLDESAFASAFGDVDLSLKIAAAGLLLVWTPQVQIIHPGVLPDDAEALAALLQKWAGAFAQDQAYNANLALTGKAYALGEAGGTHWQEFLA